MGSDLAAFLSSLVFFGLTALVVWVVWRIHLAFRSRTWIGNVARGVGLAFSAFAASLALGAFASSETGASNNTTLVVSALFGIASVLLAVGSLGPSTVIMRRITGIGWGVMMVGLLSAGALALLLPLCAPGAAAFMWREPTTHPGSSPNPESQPQP